jgi:phospholipase C
MSNLDKFDHLVVLMMENRSLDSVLGYLYEKDRPGHFLGDFDGEPAFDGVAGKALGNPGPDGRFVPVAKASFREPRDMCNPSPDPGEEHSPHVNTQFYGKDPPTREDLARPAPMNGFVRDYASVLRARGMGEVTEDAYRIIMNCFTPEALPVLNGLAKAFAVSDRWFCSVPSQTFGNRSFLHSGQSHGFVNNAPFLKWLKNGAPTIYHRLSEAKIDWRVYFDEQDLFSLTRALHPSLYPPQFSGGFRAFSRFRADCEAGELPAYTFIEPRLFVNHNDQHPPMVENPMVDSSLLAGELLIHDVYEAVRSNPAVWKRTLLVVTYDEIGGSYDHVPPPTGASPPTDAPEYELECGFPFDRFGARVPAVFISPYIEAGTVVRAGGAVPFDHTTVIRTLCEKWNLPSFGARDAAAPSLEPLLCRAEPRDDAPTFTPRPYQPMPEPLSLFLSPLQLHVFNLISAALGTTLPAAVRTIGEAIDHLEGMVRCALKGRA